MTMNLKRLLVLATVAAILGCAQSRMCSVSDPDFKGRYNNNCLIGVSLYGNPDKNRQRELELDRKIRERNQSPSRPAGPTTTRAAE